MIRFLSSIIIFTQTTGLIGTKCTITTTQLWSKFPIAGCKRANNWLIFLYMLFALPAASLHDNSWSPYEEISWRQSHPHRPQPWELVEVCSKHYIQIETGHEGKRRATFPKDLCYDLDHVQFGLLPRSHRQRRFMKAVFTEHNECIKSSFTPEQRLLLLMELGESCAPYSLWQRNS